MLIFRCRFHDTPENGEWELDDTIERYCNQRGWGEFNCPTERYCGNPTMFDLSLSEENITKYFDSYYGAVSYDNVGKALLATFQVITYDAWCDMMYKLTDSMDYLFSRFYFPILIVIGAFFSLNLIVAVIVDSFQNSRKIILEEDVAQSNDNLKSIQDRELKKGIEGSPKNETNKPSDTSRSALVNVQANVNGSSVSTPIAEEVKKNPNDFIMLNLILEYLSFFCVVGNYIAMLFDRFNISDREAYILDLIDAMFFAIFILEMLIRIYSYGLQEYVKDTYNIIDIFINFFGIIEVSMTFSSISNGNYFHE